MEYITKVMDPIEEFKEMITEKTAPLVKTEEVLKPVKSFKRLTGETSYTFGVCKNRYPYALY